MTPRPVPDTLAAPGSDISPRAFGKAAFDGLALAEAFAEEELVHTAGRTVAIEPEPQQAGSDSAPVSPTAPAHA